MQICFTHDVLRAGFGAGDAERNGRWLHALLAPILTDLGHVVRRFSETEPAVAEAVTSVVKGFGPGEPRSHWATSFSSPSSSSCIERLYAPLQRNDLVIGYELTPNQIRYFASTEIAFVDVRIDPIRFGPDLFLQMRTNDSRILRSLDAYELTAEMLLPHVALLQSTVTRSMSCDDQNAPAILFVGQTDVDGSLVCSAKLTSVRPYIDNIRDLLGIGRRLLLKPHPYGRAHQSIRILRAAFPSAMTVSDNIYALIEAGAVEHVVTLSSGVAQEARLFGKPATSLIVPDNARESLGADVVSRDRRVDVQALSSEFWSGLGKPAAVRRKPRSTTSQTAALRRCVGQSWGYAAVPRLNQRRIKPGQALSFATGGSGLDLLTLGWSRPESAGTWTDGSLATMLVDTGGEELDLILNCAAFVPRGRSPLRVAVDVSPGVRPAQHFTFPRQKTTRIVLRVPPGDASHEIAFQISGFTRPIDAGFAEDTREIGLRLVSGTVIRSRAKTESAFAAAHLWQRFRAATTAFAALASLRWGSPPVH